MSTEYSIQKMVSDGTLSTIALGIQYIQRNDIYIRVAGEETPRSGAPSGYTWSFINNTTLKILPVVPNGVEVVVYRRTDVDAMYNIYSQNAQFDEATIDENNQQLLYIAQEYFEQGVPAQLIDGVEYVREDTVNMYYRLKLSDGKYTAEFPIPKCGVAEIVSIKDFGAKGDGVTDDTAAKNAMISALGYLVIPEGVFMVDRVACDGVVVGIFGTNRLKSILKSLPGSHTHTVEVSNDGGAVIRNITIDQNESTQPAGHGVRSGGCSILDISDTTIQNCAGYGVGLQGGTSKGVKINNVLINNVGLDGVDAKDYNLNNEVVQINNLTVRNYGNRDTAQVAVDIRGIVNLTNLVAISDNNPNNRGFRFRSDSAQGRVGSGTASNIYFKGTGAGSFALQISQNVRDYSIHGVEAEGSGFLAHFEQGSAGYVSGLVGRNLGIEGCTIFSDGLTIDGLIIEGATRGFDLEPTAKNNRITNFKLSGITGANFCRVQSGAENNQLVNGIVEVGKSTGTVPATTKTIIQNVTNFKTLYKGISDNILVDSVGTKTFVFTHGLDVVVAPDLSSIRTQVVAATSGGQNAELGPVFINAITSTQIEIVLKVITPSPTPGAAVKVAIEASKYNGNP